MHDRAPSPDAQAESSALRELLRIAAPSVAATTSYTLMQFVDKFMVSKIGPDPIYVGAQGSGGMAAWIPISFFYGALAVVNSFVSQNLGAGKPQRAPAYAWNAFWLAGAFWILMLGYGALLPGIFSVLGYEPRRIELACEYGQIMVYGSILTMCTRGIGQFFYGMHRPKVVMTAGIVGNLTNLVFNWFLVYGNCGFPRLELRGSAIATIIGSAVESIIPLAIFLGPRMNQAYQTRSAWKPSLSHIREILSLGWPAGVMFGNEMICWGFFMLYLVGSFGTESSTAAFITHQWMLLSFMPAVGISNAVTSTVGKYMGMQRPDLAAHRAWLAVALAVAYMGMCGVIFVLFPGALTDVFLDPQSPPDARARVLALTRPFLIASAAFQMFDAVAMTLSGALRGAGDTRWVGIATVILAWSIIVGGGLFLVHYVPQLGPTGGWIAAAAYIISLAIAVGIRFLSGRWRSMRLVH